MKQGIEVEFVKMKHKIGSTLIWIMILAIAIFSIEVYADKIVAGSEREVANEKTMVRMTAELSKASASDNKITKTALNNNLIRYAGPNKATVTQASTTLLVVTFSKTGNAYEVNTSTGPKFDVIGIMAPYIPLGYTHVEGTDMDTGFVIEDSKGNQYVWVEVPKTTDVYQTAGLKITQFTGDEYKKIEADLQNYTSVYRGGTTYTDTWSSKEATGLTENEYNIQKKKMLKSVYKNGGFYVGRYETGIDYGEGPRTSSGATTQTPVIKQNAYPYNYVTSAQSQELSQSFASSGYTSSLMFGVQWDLVLKYMETKGTTQAELTEDSTEWGNYYNSIYEITNTSAKYSTEWGVTWSAAPYIKTSEGGTLLTTGASDKLKKQNIYDLAGNVFEFTLEKTSLEDFPVSVRGGCFAYYSVANSRNYCIVSQSFKDFGFRVALYKDEGTRADGTDEQLPYLPTGYTQVAGTDLDTGLVIEDSRGNQYVWVEVPQTTEVYKTAGLGITTFTESDYACIENDLHEYTIVYRDGTTFTDTWSSYEATGLTEVQYNTQKKKMLKSIYKNGGFYVGRYETGIDYSEGPRTGNTDITQTPVIKQNAYPYNYVKPSQAQDLTRSFQTEGYQTSLMFGVQWDLIMKYLETTGITQNDLTEDSTEWGNYKNNLYNITNTNAKYSTDYATNATYISAPYTKTSEGKTLLTTGASTEFEKQNIYDLAGNVWEWTLENSSITSSPCTMRGGHYAGIASNQPAFAYYSYSSEIYSSRYRLPCNPIQR